MPYDNTIRHALIIENTVADEMAPLIEKRSAAMLPVAGKPLIQFWCEHLSQIDVKTVKIFVRRYPEQVRAFVGEGERWGLDIEVITLPEDISTKDIYRFVLPNIQAPSLVTSLDRFPVSDLAAWLKSETVTKKLDNKLALESLADLAIVDEIVMQDIVSGISVSMPVKREMATRRMASPRDFWQINMDVLNGEIPDPLPMGYEVEKGLNVEVGVQIKPGFEFKSACRLGRHSLIDSNVSLGDSLTETVH